MLNAIIRFSLANRLLVLAATSCVVIYGLVIIPELPIDVFPDLNRPVVTIFAEAHGLAPEEVETLVAQPLESAVNGAVGVERVRSVSAGSLALIFVEFGWNTDIYRDRQVVTERVQLASATLPPDVVPTLAPMASLMGEIMLVGLISDGTLDALELRTIADWTIRPQLLAIPGVAQVTTIGGGVKQFQVLVQPESLTRLNLSLAEVERAVAASNLTTTGGYLTRGPTEFVVRNLGRVATLEDLRTSTVAWRNGVPIAVGDVARVGYGAQLKRGDASVDGRPAVILSIQKQPGGDTVALSARLDAALADLRKVLPKGVTVREDLFRQSRFIDAAVGNVEEALRDGTIIVSVVLFLFLLNFRTTAITLTAIPLSFFTAAIVMKAFGIDVNTMTLGGLAIAIGELVDDAVVGLENVFRRLKENKQSQYPRPPLEVIFAASSEVRNSIVYATILIMLAFVPLFFLSGVEGRLFVPLAIAYIVAILGSMVVSLTVTPVLCYYMLPSAPIMHRSGDAPLVAWLKRQDLKLLRFSLARPGFIIGGASIAVAVALACIPLMGREFLPPFNEGTLTVNVIAEPGISLESSDRLGAEAEKLLIEVPEVESTGRRTGRAEQDEHAEGVHYSEIDVVLAESDRSRDEILQDVRDRLAPLKGVRLNIGQPISHRLDHLLSGVQAQIAIKITGPDIGVLAQKAREVEAAAADVAGVVDLSVEKQVRIPQVQVSVDRRRAAGHGLTVADVNESLETALNGRVVSQMVDERNRFDIVVRFDEPYRQDVDALRSLLLDGPEGIKVPLSAVAQIRLADGPNQILRENGQRRIVVQCNTSGRDLGGVVADLRERIDRDVSLPAGYGITFGGQFESQERAVRVISIVSVLAIAAMFVILYGHFRSGLLALQVMVNIPLALVGGVVAIFLSGGTLSVASLIGFITLAGISARNGIMMISHYVHLMKYEGEGFTEQMIVRGSLERLVPVLMTALTAGLGVIPLAFSGGAPGKEILQPVAVVMLGGLISSTLLDQAVTPTLFHQIGRRLWPAAEHEVGPAPREFAQAAAGE
jgi:CzcA family heavy metal efflux pump